MLYCDLIDGKEKISIYCKECGQVRVFEWIMLCFLKDEKIPYLQLRHRWRIICRILQNYRTRRQSPIRFLKVEVELGIGQVGKRKMQSRVMLFPFVVQWINHIM